jgi:hypothetical protein
MSTIKAGGPAFPQQQGYPQLPDNAPWFEGLTVRDYFAAKAMQGLIQRGFTEFGNAASQYANLAFEYADAMLEAREQ